MKSCFTAETQEAEVSLKLEESNRETYVQMVSGNQVWDQSKLPLGRGTEVVNSSKEVFLGEKLGTEIVSASNTNDEQQLDEGKQAGEVTCAWGKTDVDKTQTSESSIEGSPQPEWFTNLDEVSKGKVRDLCAQAGPPPADPEYIENLKAFFNIEHSQALEVNELYHSGRLQKPSLVRLKSILKQSSTTRSMNEAGGLPKLSRRISWRDESGGSLVQKHEMKTWHYMDYGRSAANQCCQIL